MFLLDVLKGTCYQHRAKVTQMCHDFCVFLLDVLKGTCYKHRAKLTQMLFLRRGRDTDYHIIKCRLAAGWVRPFAPAFRKTTRIKHNRVMARESLRPRVFPGWLETPSTMIPIVKTTRTLATASFAHTFSCSGAFKNHCHSCSNVSLF